MINLKSKREIEIMRKAGRLLAETLDLLEDNIKPGLSTLELDKIAEKAIIARRSRPAFKGYQGYPATICASINGEVVHGIPSSKRFLQEGDIISVDIGLFFEGYYSDMARTFPVGKVSETAIKLCEVTEESLYCGISECRKGNKLGDVGAAVEEKALEHGFNVVRDWVGHGIGKNLHELPSVPNHGPRGSRMELVNGLVIAIEPMVNEGTGDVKVLKDGWTVVTKDGKLSAHFEHTVAIVDGEPEILTLSDRRPVKLKPARAVT